MLRFTLLLVLLVGTVVAYHKPTMPQPHERPRHPMARNLIVQLTSPPASHPSVSTAGKFDINDHGVKKHLQRLEREHTEFMDAVEQLIPGVSFPSERTHEDPHAAFDRARHKATRFQVVLNAVLVDPGPDISAHQAIKLIKGLAGVLEVFKDQRRFPKLEASIPLIGAPAFEELLEENELTGKGIKIASIDAGLYHKAPMFSGEGFEGPTDYSPPTGVGEEENINGKIILSKAFYRDYDPPMPGDNRTWPGPEGSSHGVHTGSTAGGVEVTGKAYGLDVKMRGVAPGAWLMSYKIFYSSEEVSGEDGSADDSQVILSVEDAVQCGADVIIASFGSEKYWLPHVNAVDLVMNAARDSGVFVSLAAGNAGPFPYTVSQGSSEMFVGSCTNSRTIKQGGIVIEGEASQELQFTHGTFSAPLEPGLVIKHDFVPAEEDFPNNTVACEPFPEEAFSGKAVLISRGVCSFVEKCRHANNSGASLAVIYNYEEPDPDALALMAGTAEIPIPCVFVSYNSGQQLLELHKNFTNTTSIHMDTKSKWNPVVPDVVHFTSARGPGIGGSLKPDIIAPGVNILAQGYADGVTGEDHHLGFGFSTGTSMAAPHIAGVYAALKQYYPSWSVDDIKSALMTTAKWDGILTSKMTGIEAAQPLDMGAGRVDMSKMTDPGILVSPLSLSFGYHYGVDKPATITVTVRNVHSVAETYTLEAVKHEVGANPVFEGVSFSADTVVVPPNGTREVDITITPGELNGTTIGDHQGYVLFHGDKGHEAHMAAWIRVLPAEPLKDALLLDMDYSPFLPPPADYEVYDVSNEYIAVMEHLNMSYDVFSLREPGQLDASLLMSYETVILFTGENFRFNPVFEGQVPSGSDILQLFNFQNAGGRLMAFGLQVFDLLDWEYLAADMIGGVPFGGRPGEEYWGQSAVPTIQTPAKIFTENLTFSFANESELYASLGYDPLEMNVIDPLVPERDASSVKPGDELLEEIPNEYFQLMGSTMDHHPIITGHRHQPSYLLQDTQLRRGVGFCFDLNIIHATLETKAGLVKAALLWLDEEPVVSVTVAAGPDSTNVVSFEGTYEATFASPQRFAFFFGDGNSSVTEWPTAGAATATHEYTECGTYEVVLLVADDFHFQTAGTVSVTLDCSTGSGGGGDTTSTGNGGGGDTTSTGNGGGGDTSSTGNGGGGDTSSTGSGGGGDTSSTGNGGGGDTSSTGSGGGKNGNDSTNAAHSPIASGAVLLLTSVMGVLLARLAVSA